MLKNIGLVVAFLVTHFIQAQTNAEDVRNSLDWFNTNFPQEKIYLHLDRIRYSPGDTIWFKAYTLDANAHLFDTVSTNIYIDFIRKGNGKIIEHQLLSAEEGFPHSNISLPDTLPDGVYEIRAYTQWMRNFSEINFFHKEIYIHNSFDAKNTANEKDTASYFEVADLQFFPEGGNLVEGLQNRVAFKAVNKFGYGVDFKGIVVSNNNDTVTVITSQHLGMGSFVIKPRHGEKYYARIEHSNSKFSLPESLSNGYAFFIDNLSNKELVKVTAKNNFTTKDRPTLIGQQRGKIIFAVESQAEGNSFVWSLRKADIPNDGIVQLTLFNAVGKPQCERLIYNDTQTSLNTSITPDKNVYQPREKVTLSINVKDDEGEPVQGYFSLAVTDASQVIENKNGDNIYNYLYLTSDVQSLKEVKGHIEQPDYYFDNTNSNAKVHLDVLLTTQGWRRFTWNEVLNQKRKIEYEIDKGITLKGKAFLPNGKISAEPITITVFSSDNGIPQYFSTKTKTDGSFAFSNLVASGETKFFLQGTSSKNKIENFKFSVDEINFPQTKSQTNLIDPFFFNAQKVKQSQQQEEELKIKLKGNSKVLKEVVVTAKKEEKEFDTRKTFYEGTNMQTVKVDKNNCGSAQSSVLQLLQGRVAGLVIGIDSQEIIQPQLAG